MGAVGTVAVGALVGDVYGTLKGEKVPMDKELLRLEEELESKSSAIPEKMRELTKNINDWRESGLRKLVDRTIFSPLYNDSIKPNCVCIHGGDASEREVIVSYIKELLNMKEIEKHRYITINYEDDIVEFLEKNEEQYQKTKGHTVMEVKEFDNLINPKIANEETIAGTKRYMGHCSNKYHSTILFTTQNPNELDPIAMADHRVTQIPIDKYAEDAKKLQEERALIDKQFQEVIEKKNEFATKMLKKHRRQGVILGAGVGLLVAISGLLLLNCGKKTEEKFDIKV